jgi:pimeloyl-ACP methyl ester carboxylesterase
MSETSNQSDAQSLARPDGAVAFTTAGTGPLIVCVPGMGDLRASYRFLTPHLVAAGYRVAAMDLRGHGDSDTTFTEYGDEPTAGDIVALIAQLGGPAIVIGNSMSAGSAVLAAAKRPELISGLVLVGPFVRDSGPVIMRTVLRVIMARAWAAASWKSYLPKLYAGTRPADFSAYRDAVAAAIKRPGYAKAFSLTTRTRHVAAESALPMVAAPSLIVMGELDPDFSDPSAEARWIANQLHGEVLMVAEAGHYPQSQRPELVGPAVAAFAHSVASHA